jgi:glycosyltransferase involved in cell wall biosynthesis
MHVMHVIDSLALGGAERMLVEIANQTATDGLPVSVCITRTDSTLSKTLKQTIPFFALGRQKRWDWKAMKTFCSIVRNCKVDLLHIHGRTTLSFVCLLRTLRLINTPIIFLDHYGIELDHSIPLWFKYMGKYCIDQYVGVSDKLGKWATTTGIALEKVRVISNGLYIKSILDIVPINIKKKLDIANDVLIGVTVGGWRKEKGLDVLIQAVNQVKLHHSFKMIVLGGARNENYFNECRYLISSLNLNDFFIFLGERHDLISLIKGVDFAIISSLSESGPLTLIEYMACGLPLVSTKVGEISKQASLLGLTEFVTPGDPRGLAEAMDRLLSLSELERRARGQRGLDVCLEHFDIRQKMCQWYHLYEKVVSGKHTHEALNHL